MSIKRALALVLVGLVLLTSPVFAAAVQVELLLSGLTDTSGNALEGGLVYTYTAGTTSAKTTWTDSAKSTTAANPIVLDSYGRANVYADGNYKLVIKTAEGVTLYTWDNLEYVSTVSPSTISVTSATITGATIASLTSTAFTISNGTISTATISNSTLSAPDITNASMSSAALYSPTLSSPVITNASFTGTTAIATPSAATEAVNKGYADALISNLATPTLAVQAANKGYVDQQIAVVAADVSTSDFGQVSQTVGYVGSFTAVAAFSGTAYQIATTTTITNTGTATGTYFVQCSPVLYLGDNISTTYVTSHLVLGSALVDGSKLTMPPASYTVSPSGTAANNAYASPKLSGYVSISASDTVTCYLYVQKPASATLNLEYPTGGGLWKWHRTGNAD